MTRPDPPRAACDGRWTPYEDIIERGTRAAYSITAAQRICFGREHKNDTPCPRLLRCLTVENADEDWAKLIRGKKAA